MDAQQLAGRVAVITGGGRGMGRAMALALASAGASVIVTAARQSEEIERVAFEARAASGEERVLPMLADVGQPADCARVVAMALSRWGRLDILINNAGRGMKYVSERFLAEPTRFWEVEPDIWRMIIDANVNGPFLMARAAVPHMLAGGWGRIVNMSMNHDTMRRRGFSPYGPSKAALESETVIWAQDLEGSGVTVNALLPGGATDTGMIPPGLPQDLRATLLPADIVVPPLLWLASPEANGISGRRLIANRWSRDDPVQALEEAGWSRG